MSKQFRDVPRVDAVGAQSVSDEDKCRKGNNPYFHPADCSCHPVAEPDPYYEGKLTPSRFTKWWPSDDPEAA